MRNPIVEITWSYDRLISTMGFPRPVRQHHYTTDSWYITFEYNSIYNNMTGRKLKLCSHYELTKDTSYLALTSDRWLNESSFVRFFEKIYCEIECTVLSSRPSSQYVLYTPIPSIVVAYNTGQCLLFTGKIAHNTSAQDWSLRNWTVQSLLQTT